MERPDLDWLMKCRQCKHYYQVQADADEVRCRLKYCRYEPSKEVIEFKQLQQELADMFVAKMCKVKKDGKESDGDGRMSDLQF